MGGKEIKTKHELWQTEQSIEVSCKFLGLFRSDYVQYAKGQLNSEWTYEVIVSSKIPTKNYRDFWLEVY